MKSSGDDDDSFITFIFTGIPILNVKLTKMLFSHPLAIAKFTTATPAVNNDLIGLKC